MGRLALETCQSDGVSDEVRSKDVPSNVSKQIRFNLSRTSKFLAARYVVGQSRKQVIIRRTWRTARHRSVLLVRNREQQIGWVPENTLSERNVL